MTEGGKWRPGKGRGVGTVFTGWKIQWEKTHLHTNTHPHAHTLEQKLTVVTGGIKAFVY